MLSELAIGPEVFRADQYADATVADICIDQISGPLFDEFLVRNLRQGKWATFVLAQDQRLNARVRLLIRSLRTQRRLIPHNPFLDADPSTDEEWENEAIGTNNVTPLAGMIFGQQSKALRHAANPMVTCPQTLAAASFWSARPCSTRIKRTTLEYNRILALMQRHANSMLFVDPHLNPSGDTYRQFDQLLAPCRGRNLTLEIHRVAWLGTGRDKLPKTGEIEAIFRGRLEPQLRTLGLKATVFLWDDFHDRFVITDLMGLSWSNGFDTSTNPTASVTISRLSKLDRDDVQKEFAANSTRRHKEHQFVIG